MKYFSKSPKETNSIAGDFLNTLRPTNQATVVTLQGELGAGKTAFAQEVGKILGVADKMQSPTFVIEKIYSLNRHGVSTSDVDTPCLQRFKRLIHIDAYRLEKESELLHLGWEEMIKEPENLVFLEWPENVSGIIPTDTRRIYFKFIDEHTREINYEN